MSETIMTEVRLQDLLDIYGADPRNWPADEALAAQALIASDPARFAAMLAEAERLDAALKAVPQPEATPHLAMRILAGAPEPVADRAPFWRPVIDLLFPQGRKWPAGAMLASLAMGLIGGYAYAGGGSTYSDADTVYLTAFSASETPDWLSVEGTP